MTNENSPTAQNSVPVVLTVAGHDPSGGAGIIADIKTITAFDCFGVAAITSLTFQNTLGVFGAVNQSAESVRGQVAPVAQDFKIAGVKTGMLPTRAVIQETARLIEEYNLPLPIIDPVVRSTSGFDLIDESALEALIENLFPFAYLVTPNIPEAERITKLKIESDDDIKQAAEIMRKLGAKNVLIKGGHLTNQEGSRQQAEAEDKRSLKSEDPLDRVARDFLFENDSLTVFTAKFIETTATHGTGCTLAAAIAANLALGKNLRESVQKAKDFVTKAIQTAPHIGHGHSPINHRK